MTTERNTSQKKFILDYLMSVKCHPTAETVYKEVKKKLPSISQGTVYRVLNNFKDKGEVLAINSKNIIHFDGDNSSHAHLICEKCGEVYDVMNYCKECKLLKGKKYKINFYGICSCCSNQKSCNKK